DESMKQKLKIQEGEKATIYEPRGCPECNFTGFTDRLAIFEIFVMNDTLRELTMRRATAEELKKEARRLGMSTMKDDGFRKVKLGLTTIQEVIDITGEEE
ncbi:MAG: type II secretion system protein GspE, partial [Candidatus Omnitrophica bacterium]|nr:type II secretion system protein GspE [Candidatus Omnitrophota bacterium]